MSRRYPLSYYRSLFLSSSASSTTQRNAAAVTSASERVAVLMSASSSSSQTIRNLSTVATTEKPREGTKNAYHHPVSEAKSAFHQTAIASFPTYYRSRFIDNLPTNENNISRQIHSLVWKKTSTYNKIYLMESWLKLQEQLRETRLSIALIQDCDNSLEDERLATIERKLSEAIMAYCDFADTLAQAGLEHDSVFQPTLRDLLGEMDGLRKEVDYLRLQQRQSSI